MITKPSLIPLGGEQNSFWTVCDHCLDLFLSNPSDDTAILDFLKQYDLSCFNVRHHDGVFGYAYTKSCQLLVTKGELNPTYLPFLKTLIEGAFLSGYPLMDDIEVDDMLSSPLCDFLVGLCYQHGLTDQQGNTIVHRIADYITPQPHHFSLFSEGDFSVPNKRGDTPFHLLFNGLSFMDEECLVNFKQTVAMMTMQGARWDSKNSQGDTPHDCLIKASQYSGHYTFPPLKQHWDDIKAMAESFFLKKDIEEEMPPTKTLPSKPTKKM